MECQCNECSWGMLIFANSPSEIGYHRKVHWAISKKPIDHLRNYIHLLPKYQSKKFGEDRSSIFPKATAKIFRYLLTLNNEILSNIQLTNRRFVQGKVGDETLTPSWKSGSQLTYLTPCFRGPWQNIYGVLAPACFARSGRLGLNITHRRSCIHDIREFAGAH